LLRVDYELSREEVLKVIRTGEHTLPGVTGCCFRHILTITIIIIIVIIITFIIGSPLPILPITIIHRPPGRLLPLRGHLLLLPVILRHLRT
jgi:hypothetical protein